MSKIRPSFIQIQHCQNRHKIVVHWPNRKVSCFRNWIYGNRSLGPKNCRMAIRIWPNRRVLLLYLDLRELRIGPKKLVELLSGFGPIEKFLALVITSGWCTCKVREWKNLRYLKKKKKIASNHIFKFEIFI